MKILIGSSQRNEIDDKYKASARKLCNFLACNNNELVWGLGSRSIMGICYEEFDKQGCNIIGITSPKYIDEVKLLPHASVEVEEDTFLLKKKLVDTSDLIIILPGGVGTVSEFFAYLEELRSNDRNIPMIVYDEEHHYDKVFAVIDDLIERNFNDKSIYNYFYITHTMDEFKEIYNNIKE